MSVANIKPRTSLHYTDLELKTWYINKMSETWCLFSSIRSCKMIGGSRVKHPLWTLFIRCSFPNTRTLCRQSTQFKSNLECLRAANTVASKRILCFRSGDC